jgi:hypothetical protein
LGLDEITTVKKRGGGGKKGKENHYTEGTVERFYKSDGK